MRLKYISKQSLIHVVKANLEMEFFVATSLLCAALLRSISLHLFSDNVDMFFLRVTEGFFDALQKMGSQTL